MSRIAAIAFAGVFVVCAVVMGVVFAMNRGDDGVDATLTPGGHIPLTITNAHVATPGGATATHIAGTAGDAAVTIGQMHVSAPTTQSWWHTPTRDTWEFATQWSQGTLTITTRTITFPSGVSSFGRTGSLQHATNNIWAGQPAIGGNLINPNNLPVQSAGFINRSTTIVITQARWVGSMQNAYCGESQTGYGFCTWSRPPYTNWQTTTRGDGVNPGIIFTSPLPTRPVAFNSQGGSAVPTQNVADGQPATQPVNPTMLNHTFRHWATVAGSATPWNFTTPITADNTINANNTLHAVWWVNPTVTFNSQGGSPTPPNQRPAHGGTITRPADPTLLNHTFRHWSETPGGTVAWDFNTTTTINRNLHAVWWVNPTITFNSQGGNPTPPQQRPAHGGQIQRPEDPTRSEYNFRHWSLTPGGATPWNFDHTVTTNQTLHAVWDRIIWRQIHFRIGNPLNNTSITTTKFVEYQRTYYFRNFVPSEQDLVFLGWATSAENARNKVIAHGTNATMNVNFVTPLTLYAVWDINWDHFPGLDGHNTMMLNFTGGINPDQSGGIVRVERQFWSWDPLSRWLPSADYMEEWEAAREPVPQNRRTFVGWFDNSAGTGTPRTSIPSTHSGPIEFWAIWTV